MSTAASIIALYSFALLLALTKSVRSLKSPPSDPTLCQSLLAGDDMSTLLRTISMASRRSRGNTSLVTMAVIANNRIKSGERYNSPSGCSIDNGITVHSEATQARTILSVTADPTAPFGSNAGMQSSQELPPRQQ